MYQQVAGFFLLNSRFIIGNARRQCSFVRAAISGISQPRHTYHKYSLIIVIYFTLTHNLRTKHIRVGSAINTRNETNAASIAHELNCLASCATQIYRRESEFMGVFNYHLCNYFNNKYPYLRFIMLLSL